jgi:hypothetical protein
MRRVRAFVLVLALPFAAAACDPGTYHPPGAPGESGGASGTGGAGGGSMHSLSDGGTDGAPAPEPDGGTTTPGAFGAVCTTNTDCASNVCFVGGLGSYCSMHCTTATAATDCPVPPTSGTCNLQGYCKK